MISTYTALFDANVLLLHLMHRAAPEHVAKWKRTQVFTSDHALLVEAVADRAQRLVTTPHVLTEVTNLSTSLSTGR